MLGSRELPEPLAVSGELVELLSVEPLRELQVRGARGDLVLLASDTDDREPIRLTLDSDQRAIASFPDLHLLEPLRPSTRRHMRTRRSPDPR